ncbi:HAD family hydrolase [Amphritea opalescens]|uniref:Histidinol-phosphatase n=1 Tax=Amphritea opalescens TaxID=2490544 RepID=A0A430KNB6_9GAMM|nr:HAD family hydrolase [Amphritea opalescens]RTE64987.1 HAD family hydrolase [Amphritea opalescens]
MSLAIFDLDNTLLNGDSDHAWGEFLCNKGIVDTQAYRQANDYFYQQYQKGTLDILEFLEFALKPLSEHEPAVLEQLHQEFMQTTVASMMLDKAATLLQKHRDQGDYLLIITATNRFVTGPIAAALGVDDTLATEPEMIDGRYTGKVAGIPCFQAGKVERLNAWLAQTGRSMDDSYFYSDSINDKPLLERVTHPVAVDPDERLKQTAEDNGWPIISLR